MRSLGEDFPEMRLIEKISRSVFSKFQMVTTSIIVSKDLNTMKIDELSGFLLTVEENQLTGEVGHVFCTRHRGRGRGRSQYQNQSHNRNPQQPQNYQENAFRGRGRSPSPFRGSSNQFRGQSRDGFHGRGRGREGSQEQQGPQCHYCHKYGHIESVGNTKTAERGGESVVTVLKQFYAY